MNKHLHLHWVKISIKSIFTTSLHAHFKAECAYTLFYHQQYKHLGGVLIGALLKNEVLLSN